MEILVRYSSNTQRGTDAVSNTTSIRDFMENHGLDYSRAIPQLDGTPLMAGQMDKTFADFGIESKCTLFVIAKMDNA